MASVTYEHVYKRYPGNVVITDMSAEIKDKEFVVLVGPSGSGKSTALRMLAGLEEISDGAVKIGDRTVNDVAPKDRDIAMVFQSYALYPHMSVYDNLSFGLKLRKTPKAEIDRRVREAAQILGLEPFLDRKPKALSGGQRQRVALGRAIVRQPKVFLMDEPLSNLDAKLRVQTRVQILKLHQRLQTTFIYVTHDQVEAMTMGDRIVVLNNGIVQQFDTPQTLYEHPVNLFVAGFIGSPAMNFLNVKVGGDGQAALTAGDGFNVPVPERLLSQAGADRGQEVVMGIRPEDLKDARFPGRDDLPKIRAKVDVVENMGSENFVYFSVGNKPFTARMDPRSSDIQPSQSIDVAIDTGHIHLFDPKSEKALVSRGAPAAAVPAIKEAEQAQPQQVR
ncbi:MAG: sn-glycerol-3-phosphate ABC transporter ATP-binding protein UgpC [Chloroflexi bacterium]|nr:MAG: sn-glycerol-3-phosphate ABC transporter ATP-binding protein UgpC [Chloroflexota bacterium]